MQAIETCRTPALRGDVACCVLCHDTHTRYRTCIYHHPHFHCAVPGGALSADPNRWIGGRRCSFLPVRALSNLFRRLFLEGLAEAHAAGKLQFFGDLEPLRDPPAFARYLAPWKNTD